MLPEFLGVASAALLAEERFFEQNVRRSGHIYFFD